MLSSLMFNYIQDNPTFTTNSPQFLQLELDDEDCKQLAYQLIDSYPFLGQSVTLYTSTGLPSQTRAVSQNDVDSIKKYLKAFIDVDRSVLEPYFLGFNAMQAERAMINEIIDKRENLYQLYVEYKRDVVERTRASTVLPSPILSPHVAMTRDASLQQVRDRDGGLCRVTGVGSLDYWELTATRAVASNVGPTPSAFAHCQVAPAIPWSVRQPYWLLIQRLFGISHPPKADIPENALILQDVIHKLFQQFKLYFDSDFKIQKRELAPVSSFIISNICHVRQGAVVHNEGWLNQSIIPPRSASVADVKYSYFLLHKLIGDIVWMAGGAQTLGLEEFGPDDDPWAITHLVTESSLPALDEELYRIQQLRQSVVHDPQSSVAVS